MKIEELRMEKDFIHRLPMRICSTGLMEPLTDSKSNWKDLKDSFLRLKGEWTEEMRKGTDKIYQT